MKQFKILAVDAEFTSFDMLGGDLLALGLVEVFDDFSLGREHVLYFRPQSTKYFSDAAHEVHRISYWEALEFPHPRESCIELLNWLKPLMPYFPLDTVSFGSWNFDIRWIEETFKKVDLISSYSKAFSDGEWINVFKMAKTNLKHAQLENFKLDSVARHYKLDLNHHEALSDTKACAQIYCNIMLKKDIWTGELF